MINHSLSHAICPSFFRYSLHGVSCGFYSRKRGKIFPRTVCVRNTVNSFYPVASNIFFPTSTVTVMASFRNLPFLDFCKDPLRNSPQLYAVYRPVMCSVSKLIITSYYHHHHSHHHALSVSRCSDQVIRHKTSNAVPPPISTHSALFPLSNALPLALPPVWPLAVQ